MAGGADVWKSADGAGGCGDCGEGVASANILFSRLNSFIDTIIKSRGLILKVR